MAPFLRLCAYPKRFFGEGVVLVFEMIILFSTFKLFFIVKWLIINSILFSIIGD